MCCESSHHRGKRAYTLLELVSVLAIASTAVATVAGGARALGATATLESARVTVALAALASRRRAYTQDQTVRMTARPGGTEVIVRAGTGPPMRFALPAGTYVSGVPARGGVGFRPTGYADNGTIEVSAAAGGRVSVVINQRGMIR